MILNNFVKIFKYCGKKLGWADMSNTVCWASFLTLKSINFYWHTARFFGCSISQFNMLLCIKSLALKEIKKLYDSRLVLYIHQFDTEMIHIPYIYIQKNKNKKKTTNYSSSWSLMNYLPFPKFMSGL